MVKLTHKRRLLFFPSHYFWKIFPYIYLGYEWYLQLDYLISRKGTNRSIYRIARNCLPLHLYSLSFSSVSLTCETKRNQSKQKTADLVFTMLEHHNNKILFHLPSQNLTSFFTKFFLTSFEDINLLGSQVWKKMG